MHTVINGRNIDCGIAFGLCHQIVRDFAALEYQGQHYPAGRTETFDDKHEVKMPWFHDIRDAIAYLERQPWTGHVMTYVMEAC